jgi:amidase
MTEAHSQNISPVTYKQHLSHFRHVATTRALNRVFAEYGVNVVIAPADSLFSCLASGSGM